MRWSASAFFTASLLLGIGGCALPVGIVYPTVSYTPSIATADDTAKEIRAFRVNFVEHRKSVKQTDSVKCDFAEINLAANGEIPGQKSAGLYYHWAFYCLPGTTDPFMGKVHVSDKWVRVRLYRRGFKTIEIGPSTSSSAPLDWEQAEDDLEKEEAIDTLVGVRKNLFKHVLPGATSESQKSFILFACAEYEQLASTIKEDSLANRQVRWRALHKASKLHELEGDKVP